MFFLDSWSMESGTEVLRVVAAIVTTFQTASELLEHIKDCKEKKKRKRDREVEELLEIKILHKSLVQVRVTTTIRALTLHQAHKHPGWRSMPQALREQTESIQSSIREWRCDSITCTQRCRHRLADRSRPWATSCASGGDLRPGLYQFA